LAEIPGVLYFFKEKAIVY